ncbi:MAG: alpha/beta hydrolase [Anaerolineae bacterium]
MRRKVLRNFLIALIVSLLITLVGTALWIGNPAQAMPEATAALESDNAVTVEQTPWLSFTASSRDATTGLIFYPGGLVDPRAYAPTMQAIAAQGFLAVIVPMPLNLAVFGANQADEVIAAHPEIAHWAIGGHSLGGSMAARYADEHSDTIDALLLLASYPAGDNDLSTAAMRVVSISGTLDGLATPEKIEASRALLPLSTLFIPIEGGNHAQFGWYGTQNGDNAASITREAQQAIVIQASIDLLTAISGAQSS